MKEIAKYFARLIFKNKILCSDGKTFEELFTSVMNQKYPSFQQVKPQGQHGDMKNDGYLQDSGLFFQVYAPEDIEKNIDLAINKFEKDFSGLFEKWKDVKEYVFVINDKYKGALVMVHQKLQDLKSVIEKNGKLKNVKIMLYTAKNLENDFLNLNDDSINSIIGTSHLVDETEIDINFQNLKEVVDYILNLPINKKIEKLIAPDFYEKIEFNGLSDSIKSRLEIYNLNKEQLDIFFQENGEYLAQEIKNRFTNLYNNAKENCNIGLDDDGDRIYSDILLKSMPANPKYGFSVCVESLIAYYFSCCDIFEEPERK